VVPYILDMLATHDSLNRAKPHIFTPIDTPYNVNETDVFATLEPLAIHGKLCTSDLQEFNLFYKDDALGIQKRLSGLSRSTNIRWNGRAGGPVIKRVFPNERLSRNMTMFYALTERGIAICKEAGRWWDVPQGGWWSHQTANGRVSAWLHIGATRDGKSFAPLTGDLGRVIDYEAHGRYYDKHRLVPDFAFHVDRYLTIETDLGNEQGDTDNAAIFESRKTLDRNVIQYARLTGHKLYYDLYGIPRNKALLNLFTFTSFAKKEQFKRLIEKHLGTCAYMLLKLLPPDYYSPYTKMQPLDLWSSPWERVGYPDFYLNDPARQ
jgi:hypothetical protein